ncbi:MAG: response regulator [Magnetovibrionaceae bacterium]
MTIYNLERLNIMLVEDNSFVRNCMEDLLRHFGCKRITSFENGQASIEFLRGMTPGTGGFDIIISDLVMAPINGLLLLRWVRSAKESPDRFTPFIMLSGAADKEYVHASRDLGVTEFLAKPFSAESVYKRLLEVIDHPRQTVTTHSYLGPDRRRQDFDPPNNEDRRQKKEEDVVIVYSADKVVKPKEATDVWYFRLPNKLKDKVGGLGMTGGGAIPMDLLEQAEEQLERAQLDFTDWALNYLADLSNLCAEALITEGRRSHIFEKINLLGHELRGQGGTFGYPLVSLFGKSLFDITGEGCREDDKAVEIVKAHIDSMRAVLRDKIGGDGGDVGRALMAGLKESIKKNAMSDPNQS